MELLRLVAQFIIVYYHLLLMFVVPFSGIQIYKALELPFHIGVILFVLISGYFGIRATLKGFLKLIFIFVVYSIPEFAFTVAHASSIEEVVKAGLLLSHTHFWFIRTYLYLYLLSPVINMFLHNCSDKKRGYLLLVLAFICCYIATVGVDFSVMDGKNVLNFIFLYVIGDSLRAKDSYYKKINGAAILGTFVLINVLLVTAYIFYNEGIIGKAIWRLSYPYSSPILIFNSILCFILFTKMNFSSSLINSLAKSSLAIYLIHANRPLFISLPSNGDYPGGIVGHFMSEIFVFVDKPLIMLLLMFLLTAVLILVCVAIDKLLSPLWNYGNKYFNVIYNRLGY